MTNALQAHTQRRLATELLELSGDHTNMISWWEDAVKMACKLRHARFTTQCNQDFIDWRSLAILAGIDHEMVTAYDKDRVWKVLAVLELAD